MKISTLVHVTQSLKYLKAPISDFSLRKGLPPVLHQLVEIAFLTSPHRAHKTSVTLQVTSTQTKTQEGYEWSIPCIQKQRITCHSLLWFPWASQCLDGSSFVRTVKTNKLTKKQSNGHEFGYMLHNSKAPSLHGDWCTPPKNNIFSSFSWLQPVKARYVNKVGKNIHVRQWKHQIIGYFQKTDHDALRYGLNRK